LEKLAVPTEALLLQSPLLAFERPIIEDDGCRKNGCANDATSSRAISLGSPISNEIGCEKDDTGSKLESAQYHNLIEDQDAAFQHNNTEFENDGGFGTEGGLTLLRGPIAMTREISHSTDATLMDTTDPYGDAPANETETIF
jgi:hypothetical protein